MKTYFVITTLLFSLFCTAQDIETDTISSHYEIKEIALEAKRTLKRGDRIVLRNLNFKGGTSELLPESIPVLEELLSIMRKYPKLKIQIQGHICCITDSRNEVSEARARLVWIYLLLNEIENDRVSFKDFGASRPIYAIPERNKMERRENRRVEIEILSN